MKSQKYINVKKCPFTWLLLSFVFIGKIHEKNSPELLLIINIFHSKTGTFCPYLRLDIANQNKIKLFSMIKGKETQFHRLYISLTLNLFRSSHCSKWWKWKTWSSICIVCFFEGQFLGEILFPWNLNGHVLISYTDTDQVQFIRS